MADKVTFSINGMKRTVAVDPELKLLDVIREELGLTGTKRGCDNSTCGTCTVVMNGKAVKSCTVALEKLEGAEVLTIEALAEGTRLHPIQQALIDAGAVQCGFCTPGIVMELYALYNKDLGVDEKKILNALNKHLCRCTGYEALWEGALLAQERMKNGS